MTNHDFKIGDVVELKSGGQSFALPDVPLLDLKGIMAHKVKFTVGDLRRHLELFQTITICSSDQLTL
jgi:hypothetical protein